MTGRCLRGTLAVLACVVLAGCAMGARAPGASVGMREDVAHLEHDLANARMAFGSAMASADASRCGELCRQHQHICRLAQRICDIARGDERAQLACERSQNQCAETRQLLPAECGCASQSPASPQ